MVVRVVGEDTLDRDGYLRIGQYTGLETRDGGGHYTVEERAAFLEALATTGAKNYGEVVDRVGRTGLAFGAACEWDGIEHQERVIVDPGTGEVLATETIMSGRVGRADHYRVESYWTVLERGYTNVLPECGDRGCLTMPPPG